MIRTVREREEERLRVAVETLTAQASGLRGAATMLAERAEMLGLPARAEGLLEAAECAEALRDVLAGQRRALEGPQRRRSAVA